MTGDPFHPDPSRPGPGSHDGPIPDDLVDQFLDREISDADRARLTGALDADSGVCERLARLSFALTRMKRGVKAPDLSEQILDRVDRLRGFVPTKHRPLVRLGRIAVAASMFGIIAGAVIVRRSTPEIVEMGRTLPLRDVALAAERDAAGMTDLASSIRATGLARMMGGLPPNGRNAGDWRIERSSWESPSDADSARHVSWSWSPVAACEESTDLSPQRVLVVVGGRVVSIDRSETRWRSGTASPSGPSAMGGASLFAPASGIAPASLKPKPSGRCVRDARLSDLP